jgi:hypothetical protein
MTGKIVQLFAIFSLLFIFFCALKDYKPLKDCTFLKNNIKLSKNNLNLEFCWGRSLIGDEDLFSWLLYSNFSKVS